MMEQPLPDLQSARREVVFLPYVLGNVPTKAQVLAVERTSIRFESNEDSEYWLGRSTLMRNVSI